MPSASASNGTVLRVSVKAFRLVPGSDHENRKSHFRISWYRFLGGIYGGLARRVKLARQGELSLLDGFSIVSLPVAPFELFYTDSCQSRPKGLLRWQ